MPNDFDFPMPSLIQFVMSKNLDWHAPRRHKRKTPIISKGMDRAFKQEAEWLACRIKTGKKSANASKCGPVRQLTRHEIEQIAVQRGYRVK